jgi:hypothetical protein
MPKNLNNEYYAQNWIEFVAILKIICKVKLPVRYEKYLLWYYYNKEPFRRLPVLEGRRITKSRAEQIVKKGIAKLRRHSVFHNLSVNFKYKRRKGGHILKNP